MNLELYVLREHRGDETNVLVYAPGGEISTVVKAEYALTFMSFGTAQQYAHELGEITGERWEVTAG